MKRSEVGHIAVALVLIGALCGLLWALAERDRARRALVSAEHLIDMMHTPVGANGGSK